MPHMKSTEILPGLRTGGYFFVAPLLGKSQCGFRAAVLGDHEVEATQHWPANIIVHLVDLTSLDNFGQSSAEIGHLHQATAYTVSVDRDYLLSKAGATHTI